MTDENKLTQQELEKEVITEFTELVKHAKNQNEHDFAEKIQKMIDQYNNSKDEKKTESFIDILSILISPDFKNKTYKDQIVDNITKFCKDNKNESMEKAQLKNDLDEIVTKFDYLIDNKDNKVVEMIGKENYDDFSNQIKSMKKSFNEEVSLENKAKIISENLESLDKWVYKKSQTVSTIPEKKSFWKIIGDLVSSSIKTIRSYIYGKSPELEKVKETVEQYNKQAANIRENNVPIKGAIVIAKAELESWKEKGSKGSKSSNLR